MLAFAVAPRKEKNKIRKRKILLINVGGLNFITSRGEKLDLGKPLDVHVGG